MLDLGSAFQSSPLWQELASIAFDGKPWPTSQAKRHHFVPRFLLCGFLSTNETRLHQLHVGTGQPHAVLPEGAASRRRFYALPPHAEREPGSLEAWLGLIESHSAPALQRLFAEREALTHADRATLSLFLALVDGRTPAGNKQAARFSDATMRMLMTGLVFSPEGFAANYRKSSGDRPAEEIEAFRLRTLAGLRDGSLGYAHPRHQGFEAAVRASSDLAQDIFASRWALLRAPAPHSFVASDRGLAMHDPSPRFPWSAQAWQSSPDAQVTIPLSKHWMLAVRPPTSEVQPAQTVVVEVSAAEVDDLNLRTYGWADEYVYGPSQHAVTELRRLARRERQRVIRPKPQHHVVMVPADPGDDFLARENARRGWPPRVEQDGQLCDYVLLGPADDPVELIERVFRLVEARGSAGIRLQHSRRPRDRGPRMPTAARLFGA